MIKTKWSQYVIFTYSYVCVHLTITKRKSRWADLGRAGVRSGNEYDQITLYGILKELLKTLC